MEHPASSDQLLLPPGYLQQSPLFSQDYGQLATEKQSFNDYTGLHLLPSYGHDWYLASQELQHHGSPAMLHQAGAIAGQMSSPMGQIPATAVNQFQQLPVADGTNSVPEQSMAPPPNPRKRKAPTLRRDEWELVKDRVIELHISQNLPLPEVKKIVEEEFKSSGFTATIRQYRTRLSQWGLDKNVKPDEMKAIVRKRQKRKLVEIDKGELAFKVRGRSVEPEKIDRWMKRNGVTDTMIYAPSPSASTPAALSAWTVSERGSLPPSPGNSMGSPASVAMSRLSSLDLGHGFHSPTPSLSSLLRHRGGEFTGQSPALSYRSISVPEAVIMQADSTHGNLPGSQMQSSPNVHRTVPTAYRYKLEDETRLRHRLFLCEMQHGKEHPETLSVLYELGLVLVEQGRYRSAEQALRRVAGGCQNYYGNNHRETLEAVNVLGLVLRDQGFYTEAERLHLRNFRARRKALGEEHPYTLTSMNNLALTYRDQGRWKEAEELEVQVVETRRKALGEEHPYTLASVSNLALIYQDQGRWKEAEELGLQVMETRKKVLGEEHPYTLTSMNNLALTYRDQGRWKEAEELGLQVMETRKKVLGEEHPDTLKSMNNLAHTWKKSQRRDKEAVALMKECVHLRERILGPDHPHMLSSRAALISWEMEDLELESSSV